MTPTSQNERERATVLAWRAERLVGLGVRPALASEFAEAVDWHDLAALLALSSRRGDVSRGWAPFAEVEPLSLREGVSGELGVDPRFVVDSGRCVMASTVKF